jgi:hypothetical protein
MPYLNDWTSAYLLTYDLNGPYTSYALLIIILDIPFSKKFGYWHLYKNSELLEKVSIVKKEILKRMSPRAKL